MDSPMGSVAFSLGWWFPSLCRAGWFDVAPLAGVFALGPSALGALHQLPTLEPEPTKPSAGPSVRLSFRPEPIPSESVLSAGGRFRPRGPGQVLLLASSFFLCSWTSSEVSLLGS